MKPASRKSKVNNIQALRAYAALFVVLFHTGYIPPTGHAVGALGVDVFFVISGYIMARICDTNPSFFLRRRLIRIIPPYWILTLFQFGLALFLPTLMSSTSAHFSELFKSLFFIPFIKESGIIRPILFVGWSLNYEVVFYLAIAFGLWITRKRPLLVASALLLIVQALCYRFGHGGALTQFYDRYYMNEFLFGLVAYYIVKWIPEGAAFRMRYVATFLAIATSLIILIVQARGITLHHVLPVYVELLCLLLITASAAASKGGHDLKSATIVLIGDASYVLYLVHPFCIYFIGRLIAPHIPLLRIDLLPGSLFAVAIATAVSLFLHLKLEVPMVNFLNNRFGGHRKTTEFKATV